MEQLDICPHPQSKENDSHLLQCGSVISATSPSLKVRLLYLIPSNICIHSIGVQNRLINDIFRTVAESRSGHEPVKRHVGLAMQQRLGAHSRVLVDDAW